MTAERPTWPHLQNLDRVLADMPDFFDLNESRESGAHRLWTITEKVHGFNARLGIDDDDVPWAGSRNTVIQQGDPTSWDRTKLQGFIGFAADTVAWLRKGETLFGEWAGKGIQKGIDYGTPRFFAFGLMHSGLLASWEELSEVAWRVGSQLVPLISATYEAPQPVLLQNIRDLPSQIDPNSGREGVVVSPYPVKTDPWGHVVIVKVKSPAFAETSKERKVRPDGHVVLLEHATAFAEEYVNGQRLEHVLATVRELLAAHGDEMVTDDPLDARATGQVLKAMYDDVVREGRHEYDALTVDDRKRVGSAINSLTKPLLTQARDRAMLDRANAVLAN